MARHHQKIPDLVIEQGKKASNAVVINPAVGSIDTLTVFGLNKAGFEANVELAYEEGPDFLPLLYKGNLVKVLSGHAVALPHMAFHKMRLLSAAPAEETQTFKILALLEVD